jgi:hypothetical protein
MTPGEDAQSFLWYVPNLLGHGWWYICSAMGLVGSLTWFLYLIMNEKFSALLLSRMLIGMGMFMIGLIPLNWGWVPWGVLFITAGCFYAAVLVATGWCHRQDKWATLATTFTPRWLRVRR